MKKNILLISALFSTSAFASGYLITPTRVNALYKGAYQNTFRISNKGDKTLGLNIDANFPAFKGKLSSFKDDTPLITPYPYDASTSTKVSPSKMKLGPRGKRTTRYRIKLPKGAAKGTYFVMMYFKMLESTAKNPLKSPTKGLAFQLTPLLNQLIPIYLNNGTPQAATPAKLTCQYNSTTLTLSLTNKSDWLQRYQLNIFDKANEAVHSNHLAVLPQSIANRSYPVDSKTPLHITVTDSEGKSVTQTCTKMKPAI